MRGLAGEQVERVGQQVEHGAEGAGCAGGASGKVEQQRAAGGVDVDAAETAAEGCEGGLAQAVLADELGDAGDEAVAEGECGLGGDVAGAEAGAAGGDEQGDGGRGGAEGCGEVGEVVGPDEGVEHVRAGLGEDGCDGGAGEIDLIAGEAAVAGGEDDRGAAGEGVGGHSERIDADGPVWTD